MLALGLGLAFNAVHAQEMEPSQDSDSESSSESSAFDWLSSLTPDDDVSAEGATTADVENTEGAEGGVDAAATSTPPAVYGETIPVEVAQEPASPRQPVRRPAVLEEVIVTAQKRDENLQDIAASITAISGDEIAVRGLNNIEQITRSIPNVTMTTENLLGLYNIRGIGKPTQGAFDPSTTAIVDDVPLPAQYLSFSFLDIQSIEVLRGPQGTLYGKNNTAGVFKIATGEPGYDFSAYLNGTLGSYGTQRAQGFVNVPLLEDVASARVKFVYDKRDGYMENTFTSEDDGRTTRSGLGARVQFEISPSLFLTTNVMYQTVDQPKGWGYQAIDCPDSLVTLARLRDQEFECETNLKSSRDAPEGQEGDALLGSGVLTWTSGEYEIKGFASYYTYESRILVDADYSPQNLLTLPLLVGGDAISSEIRLLSPNDLWDGDLSFISGLFLDRATSHIDTSLNVLPLPCADGALAPILDEIGLPELPLLCQGNSSDPVAVERIDQIQEKRVTEIAAFAQGTYKLLEPLDLTLGIRYSRVKTEKLYGENRDSCVGFPLPCVLGTAAGIRSRSVSGLSRTDDAASYKLALRYFTSDTLTTYVSAATGFKPGGYALTLLDENGETAPDEYEPEHSISYEIGAKFQFWGGAARLNIAAFDSTFDDFQVPLQRLFTTENGNAGQARTRGVEIESLFLLPAGLRLALNGSYLKAIYSDYRNAPCPQDGGNPQDADNNPTTPAVCDLSGRTLANAPKWKGAAILDGAWQPFEWPFLITAGGDATWQSKVWFQSDTDPNDTQEAYWWFNARFGIAGVNRNWDIGLTVNNVTNEYVLQTSNDIPVLGGHWGSLAAPRWFNLSASWRFE